MPRAGHEFIQYKQGGEGIGPIHVYARFFADLDSEGEILGRHDPLHAPGQ